MKNQQMNIMKNKQMDQMKCKNMKNIKMRKEMRIKNHEQSKISNKIDINSKKHKDENKGLDEIYKYYEKQKDKMKNINTKIRKYLK